MIGGLPHPVQAQGRESGRHMGIGVIRMDLKPVLQEAAGLGGMARPEGFPALLEKALLGWRLDQGGRDQEHHRPASRRAVFSRS